MLLFMEWKLFLKIASSFVPQLCTQNYIESTNPIQMISINVPKVIWSPCSQSGQEEGSLLSPQRLLCLVVHCPKVSELSLHLCPAPKKRKTNAVNNCPLRLMGLKSGLARLLWRTGGLKRLSDSTSQCERSPILLCMGNLEMVSV